MSCPSETDWQGLSVATVTGTTYSNFPNPYRPLQPLKARSWRDALFATRSWRKSVVRRAQALGLEWCNFDHVTLLVHCISIPLSIQSHAAHALSSTLSIYSPCLSPPFYFPRYWITQTCQSSHCRTQVAAHKARTAHPLLAELILGCPCRCREKHLLF
jgi:hypothetical protein